MSLRRDIDPRDLASSGWCVVFPKNVDPEIREALIPLVEHRRRQVAEHRFRVLEYIPGETKREFLRRHGAGPGPVDPDRIPYYLLLVGSPKKIPWQVQHSLSVQHAVGRLYFDTMEEYACYAKTVIAAETGRLAARPRRVVLFGTSHDQTTELMAKHLITPLRTGLSSSPYPIETILASEATKERLMALLGGEDTPALLFTATHGVGFPAGDPQQLARQGALLCQDWRGGHGPLSPSVYLAGDDVTGATRPAGLVAFFYCSHSVGTPMYLQPIGSGGTAFMEARRRLARQPFVASLPRRLLGHPAGGALAVIGCVGRVWGYSHSWQGLHGETLVFEACLKQLLDGDPAGVTLEMFSSRWAESLADLVAIEEDSDEPADKLKWVRLSAASNDASAHALLGDPAVRLPSTRSSF